MMNNGLDLLAQFMEEVSLMTDVEDTDENTDVVKLMSIHASKGLEFPIVFVSGAEENLFPMSRAMLDPSELEEERRLMYVAVTRAKDHLFLSHANMRRQRWQTKYNTPSRFIAEIPDELRKHYDLAGWAAKKSAFSHRGGSFDVEDWVYHKLFWEWEVIEVWQDLVVVRFANAKSGIRKIETRFLEKIKKGS